MKRLIFLILSVCMAGQAISQPATERIGALINNRDYFGLRRELEKTDAAGVNPIVWHMAKAFTGTYFNRPQEAIQSIGILLNEHQNEIGENTFAMLNLLTENYTNMREYATAAQLCASLAGQFAANEELSRTYASMAKLYAGLAAAPRQEITASSISVGFERDGAGMMALPVNDAKGNTHKFLFDSGAGYSILPESLVAAFNIRVLTDSVFVVGGIAGTWSKIGVAETISIGDIRAKNVLFAILPDSLLSVQHKGKSVYSIGGIIGWDFIRGFDNFVIDNKNNTLSVNVKNEPPRQQYNMMACSLHPYVETVSDTDTLVFDMDTGANAGILTARYLQRHPGKVDTSTAGTAKEGGIGGTALQKVYTIRNFPLTVGESCVIPTIDVSAGEDLYYLNELPVAVDGILGQNIIGLYDSMLIDIKSMSVNLKHRKGN